jgi:hypothetical protein
MLVVENAGPQYEGLQKIWLLLALVSYLQPSNCAGPDYLSASVYCIDYKFISLVLNELTFVEMLQIL